jgi:hypothetical protein
MFGYPKPDTEVPEGRVAAGPDRGACVKRTIIERAPAQNTHTTALNFLFIILNWTLFN